MSMLYTLLFWIIVLFAPPLYATTYYVSTTGSDAANGTSTGTAWLTPQKCATPPVAAGDTCILRDGTYSTTGPQVILISSSQSSASGTAANPITIKAENDHGAKLVQTTRSGGGAAVTIYVSRPYYVIEGFEIDGTGVTYDTSSTISHAGVGIYANNVTVRKNHIHHIARTQCSNSPFGNSGVFMNTGLSNILIERNKIHTIGRLRNAESGCSTTIWQNDHGIYITWGTNVTIQRNLIYDTNRGYCLNIYSASTSVHTGYKIYNNTFAGRPVSGSPTPSGQIITGGIWTNGQIKNNLFYGPTTSVIIQRFNLSASSSGNTVSSNRTNLDITGADFMFGGATPTGFTSTSNTENVSLGFTNAACTQSDGGCEQNNFTLTAASTAIGNGENVGLPCNAGCDQGAFQTFNFASCEVPNDAANTIRVTFTSNANLLGSTLTTFTARKNTVSNVLTGSASKIVDTIVSLPLTSSYVGGDTADISWATGGLTDNAAIGGNVNQPFVQTLTNQSCTNNAGGAPTYSLDVLNFRWLGVFGSETSLDWRGIENLSTLNVVKNGGARVRVAVKDSTSNAPPFGVILYYKKNGGSATIVPSTPGADGIAMCENSYANIGVESGAATTDRLSTSGTFVPGAVVLRAAAIPTITGLDTGFKTELEYCIRWDGTASGVYTFFLFEQNGNPVGTTAVPSATIITSQAAGGY